MGQQPTPLPSTFNDVEVPAEQIRCWHLRLQLAADDPRPRPGVAAMATGIARVQGAVSSRNVSGSACPSQYIRQSSS